MCDKIMPWALGLFVSLVVGHFVTRLVLSLIRRQVGCHDAVYTQYLLRYYRHRPIEPEFSPRPVSPTIQGIIERLFFTMMLGFNVSGIPIAMMGWLGVKMLTNLNRGDLPRHEIVRSRALTGLTGIMISMLFAFIGGIIIYKMTTCS